MQTTVLVNINQCQTFKEILDKLYMVYENMTAEQREKAVVKVETSDRGDFISVQYMRGRL